MARPRRSAGRKPVSIRPSLEAGNAALRWIGPFISLGIFAAVLYQLRHLQIGAVAAMLPSSPLFWLAFAAYFSLRPRSTS